MLDPRLLSHPVIRAEAGRRTAERFAVYCRVASETDPGYDGLLFDDVSPIVQMRDIDTDARLLADPSRPETLMYLILSGAKAEYDAQPERNADLGAERDWIPGGNGPSLMTVEDRWFAMRRSPAALVDRWLEVQNG